MSERIGEVPERLTGWAEVMGQQRPGGTTRRGSMGSRDRERCKSGAVAAACLLLSMATLPAGAQDLTTHNQPESGIIAGAGQDAKAPTANFSERTQLLIVGSSTMKPYTDMVVQHLTKEYVMPPPIERLKGTTTGIKEFCSGVGPDYPDIVAASRSMSKGEFDRCIENNVLDIIEVKIGESAVVVVAKKGDPVFELTPRMFYLGIAEEVPGKSDFQVNLTKTWRDVDKSAPEVPINLIIPAKGSGTRSFFNDNFMQGGCRHVKEIDAIFAADERVPKCTTLRDDGKVTEVPEPYGEKVVDELMKAPKGTLAVMALSVYLANKDKLELLPINGVLPSHKTIADYDYEMASEPRYYFKRAHMRNREGRGVVRGIREFMQEITQQEAFGENGYFEKLGLIALPEQQQAEQISRVRTLRRFVR